MKNRDRIRTPRLLLRSAGSTRLLPYDGVHAEVLHHLGDSHEELLQNLIRITQLSLDERLLLLVGRDEMAVVQIASWPRPCDENRISPIRPHPSLNTAYFDEREHGKHKIEGPWP